MSVSHKAPSPDSSPDGSYGTSRQACGRSSRSAAVVSGEGSPYEQEGRSHTLRTENWAAAVVDRLTFNAHIINTGTASYRLRTTKEQRP